MIKLVVDGNIRVEQILDLLLKKSYWNIFWKEDLNRVHYRVFGSCLSGMGPLLTCWPKDG